MSVFNSIRFLASSCTRLGIMIITLLWLGALAVRATDHYVSLSGTNDVGHGYPDWAGAATQIQWAVNVATNGDTVWVTNGDYYLTNQIEIATNITVRSKNGWTNTLVGYNEETHTTRCFYVTRTGVVDGFTISNGHYIGSNAYSGGGGAYVATNGRIQNCYFVYNVCSNDGYNGGGGGVYILDSGTISNCIFITNTFLGKSYSADYTMAGGGGGITLGAGDCSRILNCFFISNYSSVMGAGIYKGVSGTRSVISNCFFSYNRNGAVNVRSADVIDCVVSNNYGNGIFCYDQCNAINCSVINNYNTGFGAALWLQNSCATNCIVSGNGITGGGKSGANAVFDHCTFSNNLCTSAGSGYWGEYAGGVAIALAPPQGGSDVLLRNCLIHHNTNSSAVGGGGITMTNAALDRTKSGVINCTIVDNYSTSEGGGIRAGGETNYVVNCIIASNRTSGGSYPDIYNVANVSSNNYYYSCCPAATAGLLAPNQGNITNDPSFVNSSAANWRLANNSPCINRGTNQNWMTNSFDLDGRARIRYERVDMGAYERINEGTVYGFR